MNAAETKRALKRLWNTARLNYVRRFRAYSPSDLTAALHTLGVRPGQAVLMHARLTAFNGFSGQPAQILAAVSEAIGTNGTLLMMSSPYRSSTRKYLESSPTFDARRTPSQMGLLTEILRRSPGTVRSLNPAHPVLARGPLAQWFVAGHEAATFSCGENTPFSKLVERDGKILFFDLRMRGFTFMHHVEHTLQDRLAFSLYDDRVINVPVVSPSGERLTVPIRAFSAEAAVRRKVGVPAARMLKLPITSRIRVGNTFIALISARDALREGHRAFAEGDMFRL